MRAKRTDDFESFMEARWVGLVRAAVLLGADPHTAEDLAQSCLADCHRHWRRVEKANDPIAYAHRMLINRFRGSQRRRWRAEVPTAVNHHHWAEGTLDDPSAAVVNSRVIREALLQLPLAQRQVVVLRHCCDLSEQQTAEALGIAPGTVKSRLSRAMSTLAADPQLRSMQAEVEQ